MHLSTLLSALPLSLAAHLTIAIPPSPPLLPNPSTLPPTTHATLLGPDGALLSARLTRQNTLSFPSLGPGSHLLTLFTRDFTFPQYRVDVTPLSPSDASSPSPKESITLVQTFRGNEWSNKGPLYGSGNDTLTVSLSPSAKKDFYMQRQGFSALSILKNPMILMAVVSAGLVFGMPYLMENMDEETKKEMEEAQRNNPLTGGGSDAAAAIQNFDLAGWMAGKTSGGSKAEEKQEGGTKSLR
ncbi:hypothetical protein CAC42_1239 [Sphaceloma murrayae]|uniref:ER membrane protein complex subunit 7 beta-sandwich domain-containing protein n=1 Tax=Sphaceloma murrayae TaxID=2082308 RepID=A0A2K1R2F5_9PEZI|nr:hypothetical protein CAC42_1239 [Sphaceloma murrayae]